jgi:hypothetical protein
VRMPDLYLRISLEPDGAVPIDLPSFQQVAVVDTETGELQEGRLKHPNAAGSFYREVVSRWAQAREGMEASGHGRWFERLMGDRRASIHEYVRSRGKIYLECHFMRAWRRLNRVRRGAAQNPASIAVQFFSPAAGSSCAIV